MFSWTKISDVGSSHPIIARIAIGSAENVKLTMLPAKDKQSIVELLYELSNDLINAEKRGLKLIKEINDIYRKNIAILQQVSEEKKALSSFESIPSSSLDEAVHFLKDGKSALRKAGWILSIIFNFKENCNLSEKKIEKCKDGRLDIVESCLKQLIKADHPILTILSVYKPWYEIFNRLRNNDEHPKAPLEKYVNFRIENGKLKKPLFIYPSQPAMNLPIDEFIKASLNYLLPFIEDCISLAIMELLPPFLTFVEIPEEVN